MYIKELRLKNFGKFKEKEITLKTGINLIYGENEAGKSTIHAFIKGMFFGITRQRGRVTKDDSYTRFLPWDTPYKFEGSMDIESNGKVYRIYRNFHKDYREHRIVDVKTGKNLDVNKIEEEVYLGLTESNYKNTISIEQTKARTQKELAIEIQNFIANLSTSKNNEVNVRGAVASLQNKRKRIEERNTKSRLLLLEQRKEEYIETNKKIDGLKNNLLILVEKHKKNHLLLEKKSTFQKELESINLSISESSNKLLDHMKNDLLELQELIQKERKLKEELQRISRINHHLEEEEKRRDYNVNPKVSKHNSVGLSLIIMVLSIVIVLLTNRYHHSSMWLVLGILLVTAFYYLRYNKQGRDVRNKDDSKIEQNIQGENTSQIQDIVTKREEIISYLQSISKKEERILALYDVKDAIQLENKYEETLKSRLSVDTLRKEKNNILNSLSEFDELSLEEAYEEGLIQIEKLKWEINRLEESQSKCFLSESEYQDVMEELKKEEDEIRAINLAMGTISELSVRIHDDFGYQLNHLVSDIISKVTEGKYSDIKVDENLGIKLGYENDYIDLDKLSIGTIEQVYLALRMAVAKLIFKDKNMPLILDEPFVFYDEHRLKRTLKEIAQKNEKQIIIFTCHKRERKILDELQIEYNDISCSSG